MTARLLDGIAKHEASFEAGRQQAFDEVLELLAAVESDTAQRMAEDDCAATALRELRDAIEKRRGSPAVVDEPGGPEAIACPRCGAGVGAPCVRTDDERFPRRVEGGSHQARRAAARRLREQRRGG